MGSTWPALRGRATRAGQLTLSPMSFSHTQAITTRSGYPASPVICSRARCRCHSDRSPGDSATGLRYERFFRRADSPRPPSTARPRSPNAFGGLI